MTIYQPEKSYIDWGGEMIFIYRFDDIVWYGLF